MDFGDQVGHNLDLWEFFPALQNRAATEFKLRQQLRQVKSFVLGQVRLQVAAAAEVQLLGPADVAVAKVMQTDGDLNQSLVKLARGATIIGPQFFPNFMGLEEVALVEVL